MSETIASLVEAVLWRQGWAHTQPSREPDGPVCILRASWIALGPSDDGLDVYESVASRWLRALNKAAYTLFPERIDGPGSSELVCEAGQVSDHPDTVRADITAMLWCAQGVFIGSNAATA
jgi:hypothetical protein